MAEPLKLETADEVRDFLALCLDPGPGRPKRTLAHLAEIMPAWLHEPLAVHAPHLAELHATVARLEAEATRTRAAYAQALGRWIAGAAPSDPTHPGEAR